MVRPDRYKLSFKSFMQVLGKNWAGFKQVFCVIFVVRPAIPNFSGGRSRHGITSPQQGYMANMWDKFKIFPRLVCAFNMFLNELISKGLAKREGKGKRAKYIFA